MRLYPDKGACAYNWDAPISEIIGYYVYTGPDPEYLYKKLVKIGVSFTRVRKVPSY